MRLSEVRVENYRCLKDVKLRIDDLTVLLGENSAGKSAMLSALRFFFEATTPGPEDVHSGSPDEPIRVRVTFEDLTAADRAEFTKYAQGEKMTFTRSWDGTTVTFSGQGLAFPEFDNLKKLPGGLKRGAWKALQTAHPEWALPDASKAADVDQAMLNWEMSNPDLCETVEDDATAAYGFRSIADSKLDRRFRFVFVPGLSDASQEILERRGTLMERLLSAIADQRVSANQTLESAAAEFQVKYNALAETSHGPVLTELGKGLTKQLRQYVPSARISITPEIAPVAVPVPQVKLSAGEKEHLTDLARQGHGFQRAFIMATLEYLAHSRVAEEGTNDAPTIFLALEEPELYQHPPRARHFASTLSTLASRPSLQVTYATHSPYFVSPASYGAIRIFRRDNTGEDKLPQTTTDVIHADAATFAARLPDRFKSDVGRYLARTLTERFREAFFARVAVLVEGDTDVAVIDQVARHKNHELAADGIVMVPLTKTAIPVAHAILDTLGVPTFAIFDGDADKSDRPQSCDECGRGARRDRTQAATTNRDILAAVGGPVLDFPETSVQRRWAAFHVHLEDTLADEIDDFDKRRAALATELKSKPKSPEVYAEIIDEVGADRLPTTIVAIVDAIYQLHAAGPVRANPSSIIEPVEGTEGSSIMEPVPQPS